MKDKLLMVIALAVICFIQLVRYVVLLCISPFYIFGALFWKEDTFMKMVELYRDEISRL